MFWLIVSLILTIMFWSWINRLINRGFALGERIAISNEVAAENLAILVEALTPDALERVAAAAETRQQRNIEQLRRDAQSRSQQQQQKNLQTHNLGLVLIVSAIVLAIVFFAVSHARADDHVIRPQCWEENRDGQVYRHCEVNRPERPTAQAPRPSMHGPAPLYEYSGPVPETPPDYAPLGPYGPHRGPFAPGFGYYPTLPPQYWPSAPVYPPPPGYGPPGIVFGFGPFTVVIP